MAASILPGDEFVQDGRRYRALARPAVDGDWWMLHVRELPSGGANVIALGPHDYVVTRPSGGGAA